MAVCGKMNEKSMFVNVRLNYTLQLRTSKVVIRFIYFYYNSNGTILDYAKFVLIMGTIRFDFPNETKKVENKLLL